MKTKALISFAVTAKLICVFVFAYAKSRFSNDAAHIAKACFLMTWLINLCMLIVVYSASACMVFCLIVLYCNFCVCQQIFMTFVFIYHDSIEKKC